MTVIDSKPVFEYAGESTEIVEPSFRRVVLAGGSIATKQILDCRANAGVTDDIRQSYAPGRNLSWDLNMSSSFVQDYDQWEVAYRTALHEVADNVVCLEDLTRRFGEQYVKQAVGMLATKQENATYQKNSSLLDLHYAEANNHVSYESLHGLHGASKPEDILSAMDALHLVNVLGRIATFSLPSRYRTQRLSKRLKVTEARKTAIEEHQKDAFTMWINS